MKEEIRKKLAAGNVLAPVPVAVAKPEPVAIYETEEQYVERRIREENAERFRAEFKNHEILRKRKEVADAEEAKLTAERLERERIAKASRERAEQMSDTETCPVCGSDRVAKVAVAHNIYNSENKCIRKPRQAKACGIITADAWDMLTPAEKNNGYILRGGAAAHNAAVYREVNPTPLSSTVNPCLADAGFIDPALRR